MRIPSEIFASRSCAPQPEVLLLSVSLLYLKSVPRVPKRFTEAWIATPIDPTRDDGWRSFPTIQHITQWLSAFTATVVVLGVPAFGSAHAASTDANDSVVERIRELEHMVDNQQLELDNLYDMDNRVRPDPERGSQRTRYHPSRGWMANYGGFRTMVRSIEFTYGGKTLQVAGKQP